MASRAFSFVNSAGRRLAGVLETADDTAPHAYALFAHCFTCSKASRAAVHVSRALAARGIATLRFDFTGLGDSEGEFGGGLSSDTGDLVAAAQAMHEAGMPVTLLVGHSFGGAAVIAAAGALPAVRAVTTIGAPADAAHVLGKIDVDLSRVPDDQSVDVDIGGRPFRLRADFARDVRAQNQHERIRTLGRALLIMHAPRDSVVGIDNATELFLPAKHPKSFVSLDDADHFLSRTADAAYAAAVIATWASRFIPSAPDAGAEAEPPLAGVRVAETGGGKFQVEVTATGPRFFADEPRDVGGLASGPSPYELLSAALGACTAMTCRLYAERKGYPLERVTVEIGHTAKTATTRDRFTRDIMFEGELDATQREGLLKIADRCPVHRTLAEGVEIVTHQVDAAAPPPAQTPDDHFVEMDEACVNCD